MTKKVKPQSNVDIIEWAKHLIAESRRAREKFKHIHEGKYSEKTKEKEEKNQEDSRQDTI